MNNVSYRSVANDAVWVVSGQLLGAIGSIVGVRVMTRHLSVPSYGKFGLVLVTASLVQQCLSGPLGQAAGRFYSASVEAKQLRHFTVAILQVSIVSDIIVLGSAFLCEVGLRELGSANHQLAICGGAFAVTAGSNTLVDSVQVAARARLTVAIHQVLLQWGRPLIALGAIMLMGTSPVSAILGYIAASVVVLVSQVVCFLRKSDFAGSVSPVVNTTVTRQWRQRLLSYSTPFATWGVFTWLQIASDRWCLGRFHGMKSVAAFTVSFQLGYLPMILISVAIGQIITPRLFSIAGHGDDQARISRARNLNAIQVGMMLFVTITAVCLSVGCKDVIFSSFAAPEYVSYSGVLPVLVLGGGLFGTAQAATQYFLISGNSEALRWLKISTSLFGVFANMAGAFFFDVWGAAAANVLFAIVYMAALAWVWKRSEPNHTLPLACNQA